MSNIAQSGLERLLFVCAVAATIHSVARADDAWSERAPMQDTFVKSDEPNKAFTNSASVIVGNGREGCMMFDVSGLANVTAAKIKFYITQCGTKAGVTWPLYFRVMRNDRWNETTLTWNSLPDEFRVAPSPILATNDASVAGYVEVPAGSANTWQEVDVTEAVKAAAPQGRLALHVCTSWDSSSGDTTPLAFASSDRADETLRPTLEFTGAVDASSSSLTLLPVADTFIYRNEANQNYGSNHLVLTQDGNREGFLRFDLSGIAASSVDSAVFLVRTYSGGDQSNHGSGGTVQFQLMDNTAWNAGDVTWNNAATTTGVTPGAEWEAETPANAVRGVTSTTNLFYSIDLASLVNQTLAAGKTAMSLHVTEKQASVTNQYFFFYTKDCATDAWRPRLLVSSKVDAALTTRTPVQETFVGTGGKDTAYFSTLNWNYLQVGCDGSNAQYGLMLFDPSGLENAEYVRFRVLATYPRGNAKLLGGDGALRVTAWTTDAWSATNLTWNTLTPWFPRISSVVEGTPLDGEVASIYLAQRKGNVPYMEVDVTAAVRAAAQAGKMVTFGLFSNQAWPCFWKVESGNPAVLIFPDPDATFGSYVHASLDRTGETPALKLTWAPGSAAGATYSVERLEKDEWTTVATGFSEATCLDANAKPYETHTYRITETTSGESVTKAFDFAPEVKVFACADTYVQNGGNANTSFGTALSLVHKYDASIENSGGTREGLYRFDLSEMPENFKTATLRFYTTGPDEYYSGNDLFWVLKYPDFAWTDADAPSWNAVFGNGWPTPQARSEHLERNDPKRLEEENVNTVGNVRSRFIGGDVLEYDVSDMIRAAKAAGESHITFNTCVYDPDNRWNFGIISRERAQGVSQAAQIVFTLKNWVKRGTILVIR